MWLIETFLPRYSSEIKDQLLATNLVSDEDVKKKEGILGPEPSNF